MNCPRCGVEECALDQSCHTPFCLYNGFEKKYADVVDESTPLTDFSLESLQRECRRKNIAFNPDDSREILGARLRRDFILHDGAMTIEDWRAQRRSLA